MKITGSRADTFLRQPASDVIGVLLFGPDRGLVKERAEALMRLYSPNADDAFSSTVLTSDDLISDPARLADEMAAMSMFGGDRLVRLRLDHERSGAAISKIIQNLDKNPDKAAAKLVIEAGDMTPRSAIRKTFEAAAHFASIGCYADNLADLSQLLRRTLAENNIEIDSDALELWAPLLEGDRALSRNEIDKMILYKGAGDVDGARVSAADVKALASGAQAASITDIVMAAMNGETETCDQAYRRAVASKTSSVVILMSLQRHISQLLEAAANIQAGSTLQAAVSALRPPVFKMQQRSFMGQVRKWPHRALQHALSQSLSVEEQLKTAGAPAEALVGRLLLALSQYAARRSA